MKTDGHKSGFHSTQALPQSTKNYASHPEKLKINHYLFKNNTCMQFYSISGVDGYYVYILTNPSRTVLYTGITNDLQRRLQEHHSNKGNPKTFAGRYHCHLLLYYEKYAAPQEAIYREKQIKSWSRQKKEDLIKRDNPKWTPLNGTLF